MKILVGADIVPTPSNELSFAEGSISNLADSSITELINSADYRIFNLEVPFTDNLTPIDKCGPCLYAPTECIRGIKAFKADFVTLANNHILDQGAEGLLSTMKVLSENGIEYAGAGKTLKDAVKPHVINAGNLKLGVYCCSEHEFSIASDAAPGANPFDPLYSLDHISDLKNDCDYVIVLYHGGKESYRYPSPELQKRCRRMAEKGADLVICQHSHCIGCFEKWSDATIVYGQGNFLFDRDYNEGWNSGLLISLDTDKPDLGIEFIPLCKENAMIRTPDETERQSIMDAFFARSNEILDAQFVKEAYSEFAYSNINQYYSRILGKIGKSKLFRFFNKIGFDLKKRSYTKKNLLSVINTIECEAHREIFAEALRQEFKRK